MAVLLGIRAVGSFTIQGGLSMDTIPATCAADYQGYWYSAYGIDDRRREIVFGGPSTLTRDNNTRELYDYGLAMRQSAEIFAEWVNLRGGICLNDSSYPIRFVFVDDMGDRATTINATRFAIDHLDVDFVFGGYVK